MTFVAPALVSHAKVGGRDDWRTPDEPVLRRVRTVGEITLDPCANPECLIAVDNFTGPHAGGKDGLEESWVRAARRGLVFVNWPYSEAKRWAAKMALEARQGCRIIALVPARTDTAWWRIATAEADYVAFWRGRITFVGAEAPAPFPSVLIACNIGARAMRRAFAEVADVWCAP